MSQLEIEVLADGNIDLDVEISLFGSERRSMD
jgi:hypothetical protein